MFKRFLCCHNIVDNNDIDNEYNEIKNKIKKNIKENIQSNIKDLPNFNVFYMRETQRIYIYEGDKWTYYKIITGVCLLIEVMKKQYWNKYEQYLIEKIKYAQNEKLKKYYTSYLKKYYFFLVCLYVQPNVFEDEYYVLYLKLQETLCDSDITQKYRIMINILEHCCNKPSSFVNKKLAKMFQVEKQYDNYFYNIGNIRKK